MRQCFVWKIKVDQCRSMADLISGSELGLALMAIIACKDWHACWGRSVTVRFLDTFTMIKTDHPCTWTPCCQCVWSATVIRFRYLQLWWSCLKEIASTKHVNSFRSGIDFSFCFDSKWLTLWQWQKNDTFPFSNHFTVRDGTWMSSDLVTFLEIRNLVKVSVPIDTC